MDLVQEVQRYVVLNLARAIKPDAALLMLSRLGAEELEDELIDLPPGPDKQITLSTILDGLIAIFGMTEDEAQAALVRTAVAMTDKLEPQELALIRDQLSESLRALFQRRPQTAA